MDAEDDLDRLAGSVSDGSSIDWDEEESGASSPNLADSIRAFRDLARIADFNRSLQRASDEGMPRGEPDEGARGGRWGHFALLERIGSGAAGEVWRAWDASLRREVAVKFLQEQPGHPEGGGRDALLGEGRALARVRHPNVVAVHGIAEIEGRAGLWMELLRGPTLAEKIRRTGRLPAADVARIGTQLCSALEALDRAGFVHRDIKPSNVILEADGRAILTDFGLGWRRRLIPIRAPRSGSGTPLFMAPSLLAGGTPTPRTDLYALGVTLRWALTGRAPFVARTLDELRAETRRGEVRPIAEDRPDAPAGLANAIERAMNPAPEPTPYTASAMRAHLEAVIAGPRDPAPAPSGPGVARAPAARRPSVAVLPFLNRGGDAADEYFADGLSDELITVLSRIRDLHVSARTSSFRFKGARGALAAIGAQLGVATVLEGSVRKSATSVRISVRLVRVPDGERLWAETYDRVLDDIFAVQDDIAQRVVRELRSALLPAGGSDASADVRAEIADAVRGRGRDPEAHRLYLEGRYLVYRKTPEDLARGIARLEEAVARDPGHALAWAVLGSAFADQSHFGVTSDDEGYERGRERILRALRLEPDLAEAHARLARIQVAHDWNWYGAEASFLRALDRDPANATALHGAAILLQGLGRTDEAVRLNRRALALDPLSAATHNNLGCVRYESGRLAEAEASLRRSLELAPGRYGTRSFLAQVLAGLDRGDEALAVAAAEPDDVYRLLALVLIHRRAGREGASRAALEQMVERHGASFPLQVAEACGTRGEADAAFEWLERAYAKRDSGLMHIKPSPHFRSLRRDPRWGAFLRRVGIEAAPAPASGPGPRGA